MPRIVARSTESHGPHDDHDIEEDEGDWIVEEVCQYLVSVWLSVESVRGSVVLTPHQRPHRVDQIDRFRLDARAVLGAAAAAEGGLVLRCVAPADCVVEDMC
jgi:hypothetical protein